MVVDFAILCRSAQIQILPVQGKLASVEDRFRLVAFLPENEIFFPFFVMEGMRMSSTAGGCVRNCEFAETEEDYAVWISFSDFMSPKTIHGPTPGPGRKMVTGPTT